MAITIWSLVQLPLFSTLQEEHGIFRFMADEKLVESILHSYRQVGGINHIDGVNLPSREAVAELMRDFLKIVFPGFYDRMPMHSDQVPFFVSQMLTSISDRLRHEIQKSLEYNSTPTLKAGTSNLAKEAKRISDEFLRGLPEIRRRLALDVDAALNGDPAALSAEEIILAYPGLEAIAVQRMAHELYEAHVALIPRMMTEWAHSRTGIDIHPGARIGSHFFIDHGTGVVIGETTVIGNYVKIYHSVTLGARSTSAVDELRGKKRHPTIEDHVTIYPGAAILGGDTTLGAGSTIAANVFLTHSVPAGSLVFYEEAELKIIQKKKRSVEMSGQDFEI
jgi:serine O-acetyltransferase